MAGPQSPPAVPSLLEQYTRWRAAQQNPPGRTPAERLLNQRLAKAGADHTAQQAAAVAKAGQIEAKAFAKSVRKVALAVDGGATANAAILYGYKQYRKRGGSASLETWRRRVARG